MIPKKIDRNRSTPHDKTYIRKMSLFPYDELKEKATGYKVRCCER